MTTIKIPGDAACADASPDAYAETYPVQEARQFRNAFMALLTSEVGGLAAVFSVVARQPYVALGMAALTAITAGTTYLIGESGVKDAVVDGCQAERAGLFARIAEQSLEARHSAGNFLKDWAKSYPEIAPQLNSFAKIYSFMKQMESLPEGTRYSMLHGYAKLIGDAYASRAGA